MLAPDVMRVRLLLVEAANEKGLTVSMVVMGGGVEFGFVLAAGAVADLTIISSSCPSFMRWTSLSFLTQTLGSLRILAISCGMSSNSSQQDLSIEE